MLKSLLDNRIYREDVDRVAESDLDWDRLQDAVIIISGVSGMIGTFLVDVLMTRNRLYGLNCTIHGLARDRTTLVARFHEYAGDEHLRLLCVDLAASPMETPLTDLIDNGTRCFVIHAASNTHPVAYASDPIGTILTNVQGTHTMLDLAVRAGARRALFVSTSDIYGENTAGTSRFRESDLGYIDCNTMRAGYPESKRTGEALCQAFREHDGLDVVITRLPRVFGPTMKLTDTKAVSQFLLKAATDEDIVLKSDGNQFYSYCYVADAVSAVLTCLLRGRPGEAYNVADVSCDVSLKDLAQIVAGTVEKNVVFDTPDEIESRGFSAVTAAPMDGSKLKQLGWHPLYSLSEGVEHTVAVLKETID